MDQRVVDTFHKMNAYLGSFKVEACRKVLIEKFSEFLKAYRAVTEHRLRSIGTIQG